MSAAHLRDDEQPGVEAVDSPGRRLRIARQAKGLSQNDVASHLHLSLPIVQALEQDEHDRLPGAVFVRGYLRNYARLLGLKDESVWNAVGEPGDSAIAPAPIRAGVRPEIRSSHLGVRLVSWLIVLGLLGLLAAWWMGRLNWGGQAGDPATEIQTPATVAEDGSLRLPERSPFQPAPSPETAAPAPVEPSLPRDEQPPASGTDDAPTPTTDPAPTQESAAVSGPEPAAAPPQGATTAPEQETTIPVSEPNAPAPAPLSTKETPPAPAEVPPTAVPGGGVVLEFSGPCWVDVRDATRKFRLLGEMRKGDSRRLQGTPPYSVTLGNSPVVRITVDGKPFDVASRSRGNVARFTIDPANQE